jgi:hypothetical protein
MKHATCMLRTLRLVRRQAAWRKSCNETAKSPHARSTPRRGVPRPLHATGIYLCYVSSSDLFLFRYRTLDGEGRCIHAEEQLRLGVEGRQQSNDMACMVASFCATAAAAAAFDGASGRGGSTPDNNVYFVLAPKQSVFWWHNEPRGATDTNIPCM